MHPHLGRIAVSYPDENNYIQLLTEMNNYCLHTGNRNTGRRIFTSLVNNGYDDIEYIPEDFSTSNASKAQRKRLFYVNYSYIAENVLNMVNMYPTVKRYHEDFDWIKKNITNIERMFSHRQYFYKMGVVAFIAQYLEKFLLISFFLLWRYL